MKANKDDWTVEGALQVVQHPTVTSELWAAAVEWLLVYGPPEIQSLLQQASAHAAGKSFPELRALGFTAHGEPCYDLAAVARALDLSEEQAREIVAGKEEAHGIRQLFAAKEIHKTQ